jgi:hypothetical protein
MELLIILVVEKKKGGTTKWELKKIFMPQLN